MHTLSPALASAYSLFQLGNFGQAVALCHRILQDQHQDLQALTILAMANHALGNTDDAIATLEQALIVQPHDTSIRTALVEMLLQSAKFQSAIKHLAVLRDAYGESAPADICVMEGNAWFGLKRYETAERYYRAALKTNPIMIDVQVNLGTALSQQNKFKEAISVLSAVIEEQPQNYEAQFNLGNALKAIGKSAEALAHYQLAASCADSGAEASYNAGKLLSEQNRLEEAALSYQQALVSDPGFIRAYNNLAVVLQGLNRLEEAEQTFRQGLALAPGHVELCWNYALLQLLNGKYREAWKRYEVRWQRGAHQKRHNNRPEWRGETVADGTLLVYAEQGLGDTIQFVRFLKQVRKRVKNLILECQPALKSLLINHPQIDQVRAVGEPLPDFDFQIPLLSLPGILNSSLKDVGVSAPYIHVRPSVDSPQLLVKNTNHINVGIAWAGNPNHANDHNRSCKLNSLEPLFSMKNVEWYSLQKGPESTQVEALTTSSRVHNLSPLINSFQDTAMIIKQLDLIISVDTSVAHLAAAMNKPTWILLPFAPDWRWLMQRTDSPWYPTARLFRQTLRGNWDGVVAEVVQALGVLLSE